MAWRQSVGGGGGGGAKGYYGGYKGQQYHPVHSYAPTRRTPKYQNQTNLLLQKLLTKLDPSEETKPNPNSNKGSNEWVCHECGTTHWNHKLAKCRSCRALRPKQAIGPTPKHPATSPNTSKGPHKAQEGNNPTPGVTFSPLASDKSFLATLEPLGVGQTDGDMVVDAGGTTTHQEALGELAKAQEAYTDVASKYGQESSMAQLLLGQVEALKKQHTP